MRRWIAVLAGLAAVTTACSTVPTSSGTVPITQAPEQPEDEVSIEPVSPEPGATPEQIVRGFIDGAASTVRGHPVAREHLTPAAAETWSDEAGITVLSADFATVTTDEGRVAVTADVVGTIDQRGVFTVANDDVYTREFTVEQVDDEWRINDPPDGLLILLPDFERLYDELAVYFIDPTGRRVVPDPRYVIVGEAQPTALVGRLLAGPSAALSAGVRNPLSGAQLASAVTVENGQATVDLTGLGTDPAPVLSEISAQLVWTLDQEQLAIRTVEVRIDGEPLDLDGIPAEQTLDDWASYGPHAAPIDAVGHYLDRGVLRTVTEGKAAPGPAGEGAYRLISAAVSADGRTGELSFLAGVQNAGTGQRLLAGPYGGRLDTVLVGDTLTAPTVAATRAEAWVVRDGSAVVRVPSGGSPQLVAAPTLTGLGRAEDLQLSPDGVRAAVVVDGPSGPRLYVGTVVRAEDGAVALRDLREITPSLSNVTDVAWRDSGTLLVLAGDAAEDRTVPYSVGVDGWELTPVPTSGLPDQPDDVGAAPTRPPLVSADGTIWQLIGGTWMTLIRGAEPLPGREPFYPV